MDVGGSGFLPRDGSDWVAAEYDRSGGGGAAPMVHVVEGWLDPNGGFNFRLNRPSGCRVMGVVSPAGGGGGFIFMLRSATSHFSLLRHLKWRHEKGRTVRNIRLF